MPGPVGEQKGSYPFLNRFSTRTLRQLLREDFASREPSTPESDTFITCVAEVVARREAADPALPHFDVEAGWRNLSENRPPQSADAAPAETGAVPEADALESNLRRLAAQWAQLQDGEDPENPPEP